MKQLHIAILLLAGMLLSMTACVEDNIGSSLVSNSTAIIVDSSFSITGQSVRSDVLEARSSSKIIGSLSAEGYGDLNSDVVTQFLPATWADTAGVTADMIDSCQLSLQIAGTELTIGSGGFTGDSLVPMQISAYKLNKQLPSPIYSNFSAEGYYNPDSLLGRVTYSAVSAPYGYQLYANGQREIFREVILKLPVKLALDIYNLSKTNPEVISNPKLFAQRFPGMYLTTTFGKGRVMNFTRANVYAYYRKLTKKADNTTDTIVSQVTAIMTATPEVISNNNLKLTPDASILQAINSGQTIIMAPAGYDVNINLPIQEIIDKFKGENQNSLALVNSVKLSLPAEEITNRYNIAPPKTLLITKRSKLRDFFAGDSLTNDKDSFYANYNSSTKSYEFTGMKEYINNILKNQNGVATTDDQQLVITAVDRTTTSQESKYGTIVYETSVSPAISIPALVRLRLDKARITLTYSKLYSD